MGKHTSISIFVTLDDMKGNPIGDEVEFHSENSGASSSGGRWVVAVPAADCPLDPRIIHHVRVEVDGVNFGLADGVEEVYAGTGRIRAYAFSGENLLAQKARLIYPLALVAHESLPKGFTEADVDSCVLGELAMLGGYP